jgi:hypothetical protein
VLSGFGVEKAAHGIELTEIQSENFGPSGIIVGRDLVRRSKTTLRF